MITLKTLPQASEQEVFDQVAEHLIKQGKASRRMEHGSNVCLYHNEEGLKCAAGCLIGKDEYNPKFEGQAWTALVMDLAVPRDHVTLIRDLQEVHDSLTPDYWKEKLEDVSEKHGLDWNF